MLGILNSALASFFLKKIAFELTKGAFTKFRTNQLARLPIRTLDFNDPTNKARHGQMIDLVEQMLNLHKQLAEAKVPQAKTVLQRQIETTDRQIDELVYELYRLTEEEIKIVEKGLG
jgi:RNase P/RNase MRP subunit p29